MALWEFEYNAGGLFVAWTIRTITGRFASCCANDNFLIYIYTFIRHKGRTLRKKDTQGQKSTMYNYKLIRTTTSYHQKLYQ